MCYVPNQSGLMYSHLDIGDELGGGLRALAMSWLTQEEQ